MILSELKDKPKILSLHSRGAEREVLEQLQNYKIQLAIFHWYSGSISLISKIVDSGYYFSLNPAMIKSKSGQRIIEAIPREFVLTESDGPFVEINGLSATPQDISVVLKYLSSHWKIDTDKVQNIIKQNFFRLVNRLDVTSQ